jgi:hypothetical protein
MSDLAQANKRGGKRRPQTFTQRAVQRALRAAKAENENRIVRMNQDGSIELVPVSDKSDLTDVDPSPLEEWRKKKGRGQS